MGKYGPGVSLAEMAEMEKACVRQAVRGFLPVGYNEEGEFLLIMQHRKNAKSTS